MQGTPYAPLSKTRSALDTSVQFKHHRPPLHGSKIASLTPVESPMVAGTKPSDRAMPSSCSALRCGMLVYFPNHSLLSARRIIFLVLLPSSGGLCRQTKRVLGIGSQTKKREPSAFPYHQAQQWLRENMRNPRASRKCGLSRLPSSC